MIYFVLTFNFSHGTKCAGIIAGKNQKCGLGIAFGAQISSKRWKLHPYIEETGNPPHTSPCNLATMKTFSSYITGS